MKNLKKEMLKKGIISDPFKPGDAEKLAVIISTGLMITIVQRTLAENLVKRLKEIDEKYGKPGTAKGPARTGKGKSHK